jgi:hypothetical protein
MVQQYGPMVKNLPAMWKLYRGLKNASNNTESSSTQSKAESKVEESSSSESQESNNKKRSPQYPKGSSIPRMYI